MLPFLSLTYLFPFVLPQKMPGWKSFFFYLKFKRKKSFTNSVWSPGSIEKVEKEFVTPKCVFVSRFFKQLFVIEPDLTNQPDWFKKEKKESPLVFSITIESPSKQEIRGI